MKDTVRRKIWVRAGGRCAMCGEYLLDGDIGSDTPTIGEAAHIKGKRRGPANSTSKSSSRSPRHEFLLPGEDPDNPDNILLLCRPHHTQVDAEINAGTIDVPTLRNIKTVHERRILKATEMAMSDRTVVVRVIGDIYGETVQCSRLEATGACMRSGERIPDFALALDHATIECDLRGLPGEGVGTAAYFDAACAAIDELVDGRLRDGVARDHIGHVSLFGFARLPLLVYLGARLGDAVSAEIYQRSRLTETWDWPSDGGRAGFVVRAPESSAADQVVVIANVSGTIQSEELPETVRALPTYELRVDDDTDADANVIRTREDLKRLQRSFYELLAKIEENHKGPSVVHLFAAAPLSAAIAFGRAINSQVFPTITVYHRDRNGYASAVTISPLLGL